MAGTGVRCTNLAPGLCGGTEFSNVRLKDDAAAAKVYEGTTHDAEDIANTAYWIATLPPHVNINRIGDADLPGLRAQNDLQAEP
jgi:serine 3-dehydrogenase/3-hydroxy acid dehydrogenase/malonic semialdehyde reductase